MSKLKISPDLSLPPEVVTSTEVVYGGKGMGKTNLGSVLVEEMTKADLRWSVLDPMGVWWGLRHSPDGKGPGIECLILGGAHGDIPIEPTAGAIVADLVVDERVNTIIDFSRKSSGLMWSKGERIRFVTDYATRLFERQGSLVGGRRREPIHQILDEAARYIPQIIPSGAHDLAKCVGAWEQIVEEGRNIGLGVTFLTQRSARMNKSVSELADVMYAFRTIGPNSLEAVMDWLGEHVEKARVRDLASKVRELNIGQALVVSPGWLRVEKIAQIRERETFDSSATPKPGQQPKRVTGKASAPDLAAYQTKMAETIEKAKADDPKALRAEITTLKRQLVGASLIQPAAKPVVDQRAIDRAVAAAVKPYVLAIGKLQEKVHGVVSVVRDLAVMSVSNAEDSRADVQVGNHEKGTGANRPSASTVPQQSRSTTGRAVTPVKNEGISGVAQKILNTIAGMESLGVDQPDRVTVSALCGYSNIRSKSVQNALGSLRTGGYVTYPSDSRIALTNHGRAHAENGLPVSSLAELHAIWFGLLGGVARKILEPLIEARPGDMDTSDVASLAGYDNQRSKSFANMKGRLKTLGLIESTGDGRIGASDLLFPKGLR